MVNITLGVLFLKNYLFFVVLAHCCVQAFSNCGEWGYDSVFVVYRLLIAVASLIAKHGL